MLSPLENMWKSNLSPFPLAAAEQVNSLHSARQMFLPTTLNLDRSLSGVRRLVCVHSKKINLIQTSYGDITCSVN